MIIAPTETQIIEDMKEYLQKNTGITNFEDGSIALALVSTVARQLVRQYQVLETYHRSAYLSTSSGMYLDMIGELLNCYRFSGETDNNYRYRVAHAIEEALGSNEEAIRLRCMAVEGVKNVVIKKYARGVGTFDVYVITDDPQTPSDILEEVQTIIDSSQADGVHGKALSPKVVPVDMKIKIISNEKLSEVTKSLVEQAIYSYFDTLELGDSIIISQLGKSILNASESIVEFEYLEFKIDDRLISPRDYVSASDERLYVRNLVIL